MAMGRWFYNLPRNHQLRSNQQKQTPDRGSYLPRFFYESNGMHFDNEDKRYGSASWAIESDIRKAGLFEPKGLQIGFFNGKPLYLDSDAPMLTVGGAGSGKLRDLLAYVVCSKTPLSMLILDPRGELAATSINSLIYHKSFGYCFNPMGLHGLPMHRLNLLDILKADSPSFHSDCKFITEGLIAVNEGSNNNYFPIRARDWLENFIKALVLRDGQVSFPSLARLINTIETDPIKWSRFLEFMLDCNITSVQRCAGEILTKQSSEESREFGAIMGSIYGALSFLDDPNLLKSLENPNVSLKDLCSKDQISRIYLNIPIEYVGIWSPLLRTIFTVAMLYKGRHPDAPRLNLLIDEAGQLGHFEGLVKSFTYGRGMGIRSWAIFQDTGQLVRHYGQAGMESFIGSAQMRQFFACRSYQSAQLVSNMLGRETLQWDNNLKQEQAKRQKVDTMRSIFNGGDPFQAALDYKVHKQGQLERSKQSRNLASPDEVLSTPDGHQYLFISGLDLNPVYAEKKPYYLERSMNGLHHPNPYHPPANKILLPTRWGKKWHQVITEPVPHQYAHYPQYSDGTWSYIENYRPE